MYPNLCPEMLALCYCRHKCSTLTVHKLFRDVMVVFKGRENPLKRRSRTRTCYLVRLPAEAELIYIGTSVSLESEKDSILQFYSEPVMSFSTGEVILPLRLTCYCRHHREHKGFLIKINLYHPKTKEVVCWHVLSSLSPR